MASDLPPAYSSLHTSTVNIPAVEDPAPNYDDDTELMENDSFENKTARIGFVQKVLAIKILQLLLAGIVMGIFTAEQYDFYSFMRREDNNVHLFFLSTSACIVTFGLLVHCDQARRKDPYRYMFLVIYPLSIAFFISFVGIWNRLLGSILLAWINYCLAMFVILVYSIFAWQTKLEFMTKYGVLAASLVLILLYAIAVPCFDVDAFTVLYATITLSLETIYILCDLDNMTSKDYRIILTPNDFIDGAINLHIDYFYWITNVVFPKVSVHILERLFCIG